MAKILKSQGICLASKRVRESSKIITFYTEKYGRISFLAKGARNPRSKFGAALELFTLSDLIFYKNEQKSVYTLSDAILINSFPHLKTTEKYFFASQIVELILRATASEDRNPKLFDLLLTVLDTLDTSPHKKKSNFMSLVTAYFLKTVILLGFAPELKHCVLCKNPKVAFFSIEKGGVVCSSNKHILSKPSYGINHIKSIQYLIEKPINKSLNFSTLESTMDLVKNYLLYYLDKVTLHAIRFSG